MSSGHKMTTPCTQPLQRRRWISGIFCHREPFHLLESTCLRLMFLQPGNYLEHGVIILVALARPWSMPLDPHLTERRAGCPDLKPMMKAERSRLRKLFMQVVVHVRRCKVGFHESLARCIRIGDTEALVRNAQHLPRYKQQAAVWLGCNNRH